jgi:Arc/MetJ-type ribon-helix-helix transcriptional regulator
MQVNLSIEQQEFIDRAIDSGRLQYPEDAIREALALWIERERRREDILAAIDEAEVSLANGEGTLLTDESLSELVNDVKQRGRVRAQTAQ